MLPEVFFLKYAFPCAHILVQKKEITEQELETLKDAAVKSLPLSRELLERIFFRAFEKIVPIAQSLGKDKWDLDVLKKYFIINHNQIINQRMYSYANAPESLREMCKVYVGRVVEVKEEFIIVKYGGGKIRVVLKDLVPEVKFNDQVTIHHGYAIEIL